MSALVAIAENVSTYVDDFGRWYARINFEPPVATTYVIAHGDRLQAAARHHISAHVPLAIGRVEVITTADRHEHQQINSEAQFSITYRQR